jgi:uncharacterized SAM-binding protein YcdF (DUF218 family)
VRRIFKALVLLVVCWAVIAWLAARALIVSAPLTSADVIVVLSGSSAYVERTQKASELFREGRAPVVVLTDDLTRGGWSSAQQRNPFFVERARDELIKQGVPEEKIEIAGSATSTRDEVLLIKSYTLARGDRSVLVVTSAYHSRRALRTLRRLFDGTDVVVGLEPVPPKVSPAFWWLKPDGWRTVGVECVKVVYYWFRY